MDAILLKPKDSKELKLITDLVAKMNVPAKIISEDDLEDMGLSLLMKEADRSKTVLMETIMNKLSTEKINMTLKEVMEKYKINQQFLEAKSGLAIGTISLHFYGRKLNSARLKALNRGLQSISEELNNIELIQEEDES